MWRKVRRLSFVSSTEPTWLYLPSCQIDIFSTHPRLYIYANYIPQVQPIVSAIFPNYGGCQQSNSIWRTCESKSDKIVKEPSPVAPTSERVFAEQLTIGPKIPSQENLVSLGHKEDLSLPDNPFSTWPLVQLIFATIHLIQTWSPAPTRTLFITYEV